MRVPPGYSSDFLLMGTVSKAAGIIRTDGTDFRSGWLFLTEFLHFGVPPLILGLLHLQGFLHFLRFLYYMGLLHLLGFLHFLRIPPDCTIPYWSVPSFSGGPSAGRGVFDVSIHCMRECNLGTSGRRINRGSGVIPFSQQRVSMRHFLWTWACSPH